jgi:hypothetical protein
MNRGYDARSGSESMIPSTFRLTLSIESLVSGDKHCVGYIWHRGRWWLCCMR